MDDGFSENFPAHYREINKEVKVHNLIDGILHVHANHCLKLLFISLLTVSIEMVGIIPSVG